MAQNIEDYALIGDLRTAALVGLNGSIDWLSLPRFDSPAVYAALLGDDEHGRWSLAPLESSARVQRRYRPSTLILESTWNTAEGAVRVTDFMSPVSKSSQVIRVVDGLLGEVRMSTTIAPRTGYGKVVPTLERRGTDLRATDGETDLWLHSDGATLSEYQGAWKGEFSVAAGERVSFTLSYADTALGVRAPYADVEAADAGTDHFWSDWISHSTYNGRWDADVRESLILLKALIYAPTGGIVAAATTSLPEHLGGSRNWDYRYVWLRDATFALHAFISTGYMNEAAAWRDWLLRAVADAPGKMQIMYAVDGSRELPEQTLDWLPGYEDSMPVRIGNEAASQLQNDVWGEVLDVLQEARDAGMRPAPGEQQLRECLLDHLERSWREPDNGLWEVRGPRRHFVHSKLMAWVGVDREIQAAEAGNSHDRLHELKLLRARIYNDVTRHGFNEERRAFTQSYDSQLLDASALLIPRYGLLPWNDSRVIETVDTIQQSLTRDGLVMRYAAYSAGDNVDGMPGSEGTFLATSFWLADALHEIGRVEEAAGLFDQLLTLRNDVGLLSEEYDPSTKRHLGNTPQAFSHAGLVSTAVRLSRQPATLTVPIAA